MTFHDLTRRLFFRPNPLRDVALASYPRSGNTWIRSFVYELETGRPAPSISALSAVVPDVHLNVPAWRVGARKRYVVKTHDPRHLQSPFRRGVYILRDVRPTLVSYHRYLSSVGLVSCDLEEFFVDCLLGRYWPGSWFDHVASWTGWPGRADAGVAVVRYEDLRAGAPEAIDLLFRALGHADKAEKAGEIMGRYSFETMAALERSGIDHRPAERGAWFVGNQRTPPVLSEDEMTAIINRTAPHYAALMARFGYEV